MNIIFIMNRSSRSQTPILDFNEYKKKIIVETNNYYPNNVPILFIIFVSINITVFFAYLCNNIMHY
jgi:hypothetical protein